MSSPAFTVAEWSVSEMSVEQARGLSDAELLDAQSGTGAMRRRVDAVAAVLAAEVAYRSRRELGYEGLAQKSGARTPELLIQRLTGSSAREAHTLMRVGELIGGTTPLSGIGTAVLEGSVSLGAAEAIRSGLAVLDAEVPLDRISQVAEELLAEAGALSVEKLAGRAREAGAELDELHVADREQRLRDARYLRVSRLPDGMTRMSALLDPESAAIVVAAFDAATSPRLGGPRFVDTVEAGRAEKILRDPRTTEQIAVDAVVELIRLGDLADPGAVLGKREPAVQVLVTLNDLTQGVGVATIDGQDVPVSVETARRHICQAGAVAVLFDTDGRVMNVGRAKRLFTSRQRIALSARDGGCLFPGCSRPPSWCEAHHIQEWHADRGRTDIADGVLLCRHHHLLVHNNGWKVMRVGAEYSIVPPRTLDRHQRPLPLPQKSSTARRLQRGSSLRVAESGTSAFMAPA